jgi:hypothetical protein
MSSSKINALELSELVGAVMTKMENGGFECEPALLIVHSTSFEDVSWNIFWHEVRPIVRFLRGVRSETEKKSYQPPTHANASHAALARIEDDAPILE